MKVVFLGTPDFVLPIKQELAKHFTLVDSLNEADLGVVAAYGHILTKDELNAPKYGCINVHPSLLPKYRGSSPIQQAILNGDKTSGITIIKMDEEIDHGPILYQENLELSDNDNFETLSKKMFQHAADILPKIIEDFIASARTSFMAGKITPHRQNHAIATFCPKLTRESGYFPIDNLPAGRQVPPSEKFDRMIRAYHPWPGVWTRWNGKIVKFLPASRHPALDAGSIKIDSGLRQNDKGFFIQMEGKKPISLKDFLNGYPEFPLYDTILSKP